MRAVFGRLLWLEKSSQRPGAAGDVAVLGSHRKVHTEWGRSPESDVMSEREMRSETRSLDLARRWLSKKALSEPQPTQLISFLTSHNLSCLCCLAFSFCLIYSFIIAVSYSSVICIMCNSPPVQYVYVHCENLLLFSPPPGTWRAAFSVSGGATSRCSGQIPRGIILTPPGLSRSTSPNSGTVRPGCSSLFLPSLSVHCLLPRLLQQHPYL